MIEELHELMNFYPISSNQQATGALLDYVENRLSQRGLQVERLEHQGVHSLYASTRGQKHAKIMLQGHIDVVPGGEVFRHEGDKVYGRGSYDMLFGTASFLRLVNNLDTPASYDISILLTGDEELGGVDGVGAVLEAEQYSCDVCILPDAGEVLGTMSVAAKGIWSLRLKVNGTSHHGSRPWEGDGAGNKLIALINELAQAFDTTDHSNSTFVVSQLQAGSDALNQGPAEAFVGIDIRYKDTADYDRIRKLLDKLLVRYSSEIVFEQIGRSFSLDPERPLVKQFTDIYAEEMGHPVQYIRAHGSSDARFFDSKGMPVIMFRPDGGNAHGDGEWLSVSSWEKFQQILERYVLENAKI